MKESDVNYELLKKIVFENPNNYTLGEVIRKLVAEIQDGKKKT